MERDQDSMFLGAVLRRARLAAGITSQDALAEKLGDERTVIAKAESGQLAAIAGRGPCLR